MHICSGAYANNVQCMCSRVPAHIVDCGGFIGSIYTDIELSCGCKLIGMYGLYVAFKGILVFVMYMAITGLANAAFNCTIAFVMLR